MALVIVLLSPSALTIQLSEGWDNLNDGARALVDYQYFHLFQKLEKL